MPWWDWTLVGWIGLSFVLGPLIGRWLKSARLPEEARAWRQIRRADEQVPGPEGRGGVQGASARVLDPQGRENASCDEEPRDQAAGGRGGGHW